MITHFSPRSTKTKFLYREAPTKEEVLAELTGYGQGQHSREMFSTAIRSILAQISELETRQESEKPLSPVEQQQIASRAQFEALLARVENLASTEVTNIERDAMQSTNGWCFTDEFVRDLVRLTAEAGFQNLEISGGQSFQNALLAGYDPLRVLRVASEECRRIETERAENQEGPVAPRRQMLLRGQSLIGFRFYSEETARHLIEQFAQAGIDIIRNFDALNDPRNLEPTLRICREWNETHPENPVHMQVGMSFCRYPFNNDDNENTAQYGITYWVNYAKKLIDMGGDAIQSFAIKDMSGQLTSALAEKLIPALQALGKPLALHIHSTNGEKSLKTIHTAYRAGINVIEVATEPLAGGAAHHNVRDVIRDDLVQTIRVTNPDDLELIQKVQEGELTLDEIKDPAVLARVVEGKKGLDALEESMRKHHTKERADLKIKKEHRERFSLAGVPGGAIPFVLEDLTANVIGKRKEDGTYTMTPLRQSLGIDTKNVSDMDQDRLQNTAIELFLNELKAVCCESANVGLVTPSADILCKQAIMNLCSQLMGAGTILHGSNTSLIYVMTHETVIAKRYATFDPRFAKFMRGEYGQVINHATGEVIPFSLVVKAKALAFLDHEELTTHPTENLPTGEREAVRAEVTTFVENNWEGVQFYTGLSDRNQIIQELITLVVVRPAEFKTPADLLNTTIKRYGEKLEAERKAAEKEANKTLEAIIKAIEGLRNHGIDLAKNNGRPNLPSLSETGRVQLEQRLREQLSTVIGEARCNDWITRMVSNPRDVIREIDVFIGGVPKKPENRQTGVTPSSTPDKSGIPVGEDEAEEVREGENEGLRLSALPDRGEFIKHELLRVEEEIKRVDFLVRSISKELRPPDVRDKEDAFLLELREVLLQEQQMLQKILLDEENIKVLFKSIARLAFLKMREAKIYARMSACRTQEIPFNEVPGGMTPLSFEQISREDQKERVDTALDSVRRSVKNYLLGQVLLAMLQSAHTTVRTAGYMPISNEFIGEDGMVVSRNVPPPPPVQPRPFEGEIPKNLMDRPPKGVRSRQ